MREICKDGELVGEIRQPSDRLLTYLIDRMAPVRMDHAGSSWTRILQWSNAAAAALDTGLAALTDSAVPAEPLNPFSYQPTALSNGAERFGPSFTAPEPDMRPRDARQGVTFVTFRLDRRCRALNACRDAIPCGVRARPVPAVPRAHAPPASTGGSRTGTR